MNLTINNLPPGRVKMAITTPWYWSRFYSSPLYVSRSVHWWLVFLEELSWARSPAPADSETQIKLKTFIKTVTFRNKWSITFKVSNKKRSFFCVCREQAEAVEFWLCISQPVLFCCCCCCCCCCSLTSTFGLIFSRSSVFFWGAYAQGGGLWPW